MLQMQLKVDSISKAYGFKKHIGDFGIIQFVCIFPKYRSNFRVFCQYVLLPCVVSFGYVLVYCSNLLLKTRRFVNCIVHMY